jgi:hypothetical protein
MYLPAGMRWLPGDLTRGWSYRERFGEAYRRRDSIAETRPYKRDGKLDNVSFSDLSLRVGRENVSRDSRQTLTGLGDQ